MCFVHKKSKIFLLSQINFITPIENTYYRICSDFNFHI